MRKICLGVIALWMLVCSANAAQAGVSIGIGLPNVSIGINLPVYPDLVPVPGYPVYYAPGIAGNYFFYDGMYWVYQNDNWYASSWYNGPWGYVDPMSVPLYVLRVPVGYYRQPPVYFGGWQSNAPPRWGDHWGRSWEQRRGGWDHWSRNSAPRPAPLPTYQRQYAGDRYPRVEQQRALRTQSYHYQPHDKVVQQHFKAEQKAPAAGHGKQQQPAAAAKHQQPAAQHQQGVQQQHQQPAAQHAPQQQQRQQPAAQHAPQQQQRQQPAAQHAPQQQQRQQPAAQHAPQQQQRQQPAAQHAPQQQQGGHEQRGGGQEHGQGQNREEGHNR